MGDRQTIWVFGRCQMQLADPACRPNFTPIGMTCAGKSIVWPWFWEYIRIDTLELGIVAEGIGSFYPLRL